MNRPSHLGIHRSHVIDRLAQQIEHPPQRRFPHRHRHRRSGIHHFHAAGHTVGASQRHRPHLAAAEMLLHLSGHRNPPALEFCIDLQSIIDTRQVLFRERRIEGRSNHLNDFTLIHLYCSVSDSMPAPRRRLEYPAIPKLSASAAPD